MLLAMALLLALPLSASAATANVTTELTDVRSYYAQQSELTLFEETLALASMGMLTGKTPFIPQEDGTAEALAKRILSQSAANMIPETPTEPEELKGLQNNDGAFGNVESHCYSMLALTARKETFNSAKAYEWLIKQQKENGSFGDSVKETALAVCVLSLSKNQQEMEAKNRGVSFLIGYEATDCIGLSWQIMGITDGGTDAATAGGRDLLEKLLSYQNSENHAFYSTKNSDKTDGEATAMALAALDAINEDSGMLQRLASDGKLTFFEWKDAKPLMIFGGVLLGISSLFWLYILFHKKSNKTLEETKTY